MTTNDPIADMLTRIRNANTAKHDTVDIPSSRVKLAESARRTGHCHRIYKQRHHDRQEGKRAESWRRGPGFRLVIFPEN